MTGDNFEYAIKKDVRNNPIVREVDRERHREMWRSLLVGLLLVAVLVFSVWRQMALLSHGYRTDELRAAIAAAEAENRDWRLEHEMLRSSAQLAIAARKLGMIQPGLEDHTVLTRVVASPLPSRSVVAQR